MIDSLSFLLFILLSVTLCYVSAGKHPLGRLFWIVLPGMVLMYIVHPLALLYAFVCLAFCVGIFVIGKRLSSARLKTRLPYTILLLLFLPDAFNFQNVNPVLYLGAAFFIIRQMMTTTDALKRNLPASEFLPALLAGTFFFAALPSGPVFNGSTVWKQLQQRLPVAGSEGVYRLFEGFVCLTAVAGFFGVGIGWLREHDVFWAVLEWGGVAGDFAFQVVRMTMVVFLSFGFLFASFYGYSRMAEGAAMLMGFTVPQNFDRPWLATDLANFWKRWHISMANFVMQYIYLPLLVSYNNARLALVCAFLFMGIWHKLSAEFMLWGLGHGVGLSYLLPWLQNRSVSPRVIRWLSLGYVVFLSSIAHEVWTS